MQLKVGEAKSEPGRGWGLPGVQVQLLANIPDERHDDENLTELLFLPL